MLWLRTPLLVSYLFGAVLTYGHEVARWDHNPSPCYSPPCVPNELAGIFAGLAWPIYLPLRISETAWRRSYQ